MGSRDIDSELVSIRLASVSNEAIIPTQPSAHGGRVVRARLIALSDNAPPLSINLPNLPLSPSLDMPRACSKLDGQQVLYVPCWRGRVLEDGAEEAVISRRHVSPSASFVYLSVLQHSNSNGGDSPSYITVSNAYSVGDLIDAMDTRNMWLEASVVSIKDDMLLLHYPQVRNT